MALTEKNTQSSLKKQGAALASSLFKTIKKSILFLCVFSYDFYCFGTRSGWRESTSKEVLEAVLIKGYHGIEKGLALPNPRSGFGQDAIEALLSGTETYISLYGPDSTTRTIFNVLHKYLDFNEARSFDLPGVRARLAGLETAQSNACPHEEGGVLPVSKKDILQKAAIDFSSFLNCRYSVRQFSSDPVSLKTIQDAVRMAQRTPSVCNRQSGCVFVIEDKKRIEQALLLQNGNRGFRDQIDKLLIVTSNLESFLSPVERNQQWVDGGMFAMTLVYALHSLGLGACCLNWDVNPFKDIKLKKTADIPTNHAIILMIAVGNLPDHFVVAQSPRKSLERVFFVV